jgi:hypothetical protein
MFLHNVEMAFLAPVYNIKIHMSTRGEYSGELADIIQNNAPVDSLCNSIAINVSQVF